MKTFQQTIVLFTFALLALTGAKAKNNLLQSSRELRTYNDCGNIKGRQLECESLPDNRCEWCVLERRSKVSMSAKKQAISGILRMHSDTPGSLWIE
jgi:hypothetical protein